MLLSVRGPQMHGAMPASPGAMSMSPRTHSSGAGAQVHSSAPSSPATSPAAAAPLAAANQPGFYGSSLPPSAASQPTSLRAGGRMFQPLSGNVGCRHSSILTSAPPVPHFARQNKHAKHSALLEAASLAAARIKSKGDLTPSSPGTGAAKLDWHTSGDRYIGQQIMRCVYDGATLAGMARATVIGWLPAGESDFEDALGRPQPLWLVRFCAGSLIEGDEEELELHELADSIDHEGNESGADDELAYEGGLLEHGVSAGGGSDFSLDGSEWVGGSGQLFDGRTGGRRGKRRCGQCAACKADDCDVCKFCKDKAKNGGANTLRRPCSARLPCCARPQANDTSTPPAGDTSTAA